MKPWKQVIYYSYNENMTKKLLMNMIEVCEQHFAEVRVMVCDMGNGKLLSSLDVYSKHNHHFPNPTVPSRKVFIVPDVPHCLKNLRNHTLDDDLVIKKSDGNCVTLTKEHFCRLIDRDSECGDFRLCYKLSKYHIDVKGSERQRVRTATELLSDTVSKALLFYFSDEMKEQAEIISVVDDWFDVMNSRLKYCAKNKKCGLGKYFSNLK